MAGMNRRKKKRKITGLDVKNNEENRKYREDSDAEGEKGQI